MTDTATQPAGTGPGSPPRRPAGPRLVRAAPAARRNGRRAPRGCRSSSATAGTSTIRLPRSGRNRTTRTLRRDLREVTREIRPDWDLSAPGLRAAWDAGDRARHYPYRQVDHTRSPAEALSDADHNATVRSNNSKSFFPNEPWSHFYARRHRPWSIWSP